MSALNLKEVLQQHLLWLNDEGGVRANLSGANLRRAYLYGAVGNMAELKSLFLDRWPVTYTDKVLQIGCQQHLIEEWFCFSDEEISSMDSDALEWWGKHRDLIKQSIALSPATPQEKLGK